MRFSRFLPTAVALLAFTAASCNAPAPSAPAASTVEREDGDAYSIKVHWAIAEPERVRDAMRAAADRWSRVLRAPAGGGAARAAHRCGGVPVADATVAHLHLIVAPLPNGLPHVADAAPCETRRDGTTVTAIVRIAVDRLRDVAPMSVEDLFAHEIGHALGFHPSWFFRGVTVPSTRLPATTDRDLRFVGASATRLAEAVAGVQMRAGIPIAQDDPAHSHWSSSLSGEMMAWAAVADMRISAITLGALVDLGYRVRIDRAESFVMSTPAAVRASSAAQRRPVCGAHGLVVGW